MNKKEQELRQSLQEKRDNAQELINEGKTEEARGVMDEAKTLKQQIELLTEARDLDAPEVEDRDIQPEVDEPEERSGKDKDAEYRNAFMKAVRGKNRLSREEMEILESRAMTEGDDKKGGYTVPQDIETKINELKRQINSLEDFVNVESVGTKSGSRVMEKNGEMTPFEDLEEMDDIEEMDGPRFDQIKYDIKNYAGFLPISNDLLNDTAENLMDYLSNWIAKKSIVTRNKLILDVLDEADKESFEDYDDLKKALNVTLDPEIASGAIILTNQDGFNYLDKQKDGNDNYILQPKPTDSTKKQFAGKDVVVLSNKYLETSDDKAPVIVGDLEEAVVLFDRQGYSIDTTETGGNAWRKNSTEMRVIEREDVKSWDDEAFVYGEVDISGES